MRAAVEPAFQIHNTKFEGHLEHGYLDVKGLWTSSVGILMDTSEWDSELGHAVPPGYAELKKKARERGEPAPHPMISGAKPWLPMLAFPWLRYGDNQPASEREKIIEWCWIWGSNAPDMPLDYSPKTNPFRAERMRNALQGGRYFKQFCKLYLSEEAIRESVRSKLSLNETYLARRFGPLWEEFAASTQLALHLLSWACGPAFRFPRLEAYLRKREYAIYADTPKGRVLVGGCAVECQISTAGNPGVIPRNKAMRALFEEAEAVQSMGLDPDALFYPGPVINEAVKQYQEEADKKRSDEK